MIYYLNRCAPSKRRPMSARRFRCCRECRPLAPAIAISGILLFTVLVVIIAALQVRRMEINYGTD